MTNINTNMIQARTTLRRGLWGFTPRELDVLEGLYWGKKAAEIAAGLGTSKRTVEAQIRGLRAHYRANNVIQLMRAIEARAQAQGQVDLLKQISNWQRAAYEAMRAAQTTRKEAFAHDLMQKAFAPKQKRATK